MANKESWEYEMEYKQKGEQIAKELEDMINCCPYGSGIGIKTTVDYLAHRCHPYLRQELFKNLILGFIAEMTVGYHDGRDEASVKTCQYICDKLLKAWDEERVCIMEPKMP